MDKQVNPAVKLVLFLAIFISQFMCGLATVTSVSPKYRTPVHAIWAGAVRAVLFVWGAKLIEAGGVTPVYTIVVSCTVIFLFFSFAIPIGLGLFAFGSAKWPKMGPWNLDRGVFSLFAVLSILAMVLILVIGVQPPDDMALNITIGFLIVTAVVWLAFEQRRFRGPPIGDAIARRQAEIAAAEAALGRPD